MGDVVKWGLLVAGIVLVVALIFQLPVFDFMDFDELNWALGSICNICADIFMFARGLINNFLTEFGRTAATGVIFWVICKPFILEAIKYIVMVYHYIFK